MSLLRALSTSFSAELKLRVVSPMSWFAIVVQPVIFSAIGLFLFTTGGHRSHDAYPIIGGGLIGLWSVTLFNAGFSIEMERRNGTLEQLFACPTPLQVIMAGKVAANMAIALTSFGLSFGLAALGFGLVPRVEWGVFIPSFALTLVGFFAMGLVLAPLFVTVTFRGGMLNAFEVPLYLLVGIMFPISQLPAWTHPLSWILGPTWTVRAMFSATGEPPAHPLYTLWWLIAAALTGLYLLTSTVLFRLVDRRARASGQLASM